MTASKIRVNMISESEFTVQGHGVHTAFVEITNALRRHPEVDIQVNSDRPADIVHIQTVGMYATKRLLSRNGKKVVSAHIVPDSFIGSLFAAQLWRPFATWWLRFFYGRADRVLACSKMVQQELQHNMKLKNVDLLYNSIDMAQYAPSEASRAQARQALGFSEDAFVVIGNGQVQPRKRLDTFMKMAQACPEMKFVWIGGIPFGRLGADYAAMQRLMTEHPANVTITDIIPHDEVKNYYAAADVFVLPAEQENHPMCVLEAAGAELPIVLRDIPEYEDTFRGHAVLAADDDAFIAAVQSLHSDTTAYKKSQQGSREIAQRFDSSASAERLVDLYRSLLA